MSRKKPGDLTPEAQAIRDANHAARDTTGNAEADVGPLFADGVTVQRSTSYGSIYTLTLFDLGNGFVNVAHAERKSRGGTKERMKELEGPAAYAQLNLPRTYEETFPPTEADAPALA